MTTEQTDGVRAIKLYFEKKDGVTPGGGRVVSSGEIRELKDDDRVELGTLCVRELGVTLKVQQE